MTRLSDFTTAPSLYGPRTVGWKNDKGDITINPNVAATWVASGAYKSVERVYVQST